MPQAALHARKSHAPPRRAVRPVVPGTARVVRAAAKLDGVSTGARAIADPPARDAEAPADATLDAFLAGVGPRAFRFAEAGLRHSEDAMDAVRWEEHTSELQSLMRISYAVFCLKTKK